MLVIGTTLVLLYVLWTVRGSLLPFAIGAVLAYLLSPLIDRIERIIPKHPRIEDARRTIAILVVYVGTALLILVLSITVIPTMVRETFDFVNDLPNYWDSAQEELDYWTDRYRRDVPPEVRDQIEANVDKISDSLANIAQTIITATIGTVGSFIGLLAGLLLLPLWLYYVLKDEEAMKRFFYNLWPESIRDDVYEVTAIIDRVLAAYIRGQLFLGVVIGLASGIGLWLIGVQQPVALGVVAGILELVPIIGPWLTFIIAALVVLATDPGKVLLVGILFLGIQQLENTFLVPRVQGNAVNMNPAAIMILLVVGGALWGVLGVIVIVPLAAVLRDVFLWVYWRLSDPDEVSIDLDPRANLEESDR